MSSVTESDARLSDAISKLWKDPDLESAWKVVYEELQPMCARIARAVFADDTASITQAVQDTIVQLYLGRVASVIRDSSKFRAYAATTCRNCVNSMLRSSSRLNRKELGLDAVEGRGGEDVDLGISRALLDQEAMERALDGVLSSLEEGEKQLLVLIMDGADYKYVAKRLEIRESAAAVRINRLKQKIRKVLQDNEL